MFFSVVVLVWFFFVSSAHCTMHAAAERSASGLSDPPRLCHGRADVALRLTSSSLPPTPYPAPSTTAAPPSNQPISQSASYQSIARDEARRPRTPSRVESSRISPNVRSQLPSHSCRRSIVGCRRHSIPPMTMRAMLSGRLRLARRSRCRYLSADRGCADGPSSFASTAARVRGAAAVCVLGPGLSAGSIWRSIELCVDDCLPPTLLLLCCVCPSPPPPRTDGQARQARDRALQGPAMLRRGWHHRQGRPEMCG